MYRGYSVVRNVAVLAFTIVCLYLLPVTTQRTAGRHPFMSKVSVSLELDSNAKNSTLVCTYNEGHNNHTNNFTAALMWLGIIKGRIVRLQPQNTILITHHVNSDPQTHVLRLQLDSKYLKKQIQIWCQALVNDKSIIFSSVYTHNPPNKNHACCGGNNASMSQTRAPTAGAATEAAAQAAVTQPLQPHREMAAGHLGLAIMRRQSENMTTDKESTEECSDGIIALLVVASVSCLGGGIACTLTTLYFGKKMCERVTAFKRSYASERYRSRPRASTICQPLEIVNNERETLPRGLSGLNGSKADDLSSDNCTNSNRDSLYVDMSGSYTGHVYVKESYSPN